VDTSAAWAPSHTTGQAEIDLEFPVPRCLAPDRGPLSEMKNKAAFEPGR
jgi:hypothetical protein